MIAEMIQRVTDVVARNREEDMIAPIWRPAESAEKQETVRSKHVWA